MPASDYTTGIIVGVAVVLGLVLLLQQNRSAGDKVKDAGRDLKSAAKDAVR